jgi:hypothetical protein
MLAANGTPEGVPGRCRNNDAHYCKEVLARRRDGKKQNRVWKARDFA